MHSITKLSFIFQIHHQEEKSGGGGEEKSEIKSQYYKEHDSHEVNHINLRLFSLVTSCYLLNKTLTLQGFK